MALPIVDHGALSPSPPSPGVCPCTCSKTVHRAPEPRSARSVQVAAQSGSRKNGYFSDVDPNGGRATSWNSSPCICSTAAEIVLRAVAPIRSPLDRFRAGDPTKRGGRYKSEFIWNSNWQEQVSSPAPWCLRSTSNGVLVRLQACLPLASISLAI